LVSAKDKVTHCMWVSWYVGTLVCE